MGTCIYRAITAACYLLSFSPAAAQTAPPPPSSRAEFQVAGRHRLAVSVGVWRLTEDAPESSVVRVGASTADVFAGLQYTRFLTEAVAVTLGTQVLPYESGIAVGTGGVAVGTRTIVALPFGVQWNPVAARTRTSPLKPYVSGTIGPVIGSGDGVRVGPRGVAVNSDTAATVGGSVGGGVDVHLARSWSAGAALGYAWMADFPDPIGERDNYSGIQVRLTLGWLFGRGRAAP